MIPINMPQVGQNIPSARIVEWTKKEGETIRKDEVIALVESDKATFEVLSDQPGVLLKILVPAGEEGEVFKPIAWLGQVGEQIPADFSGTRAPSAVATTEMEPAAIESASPGTTPGRQFASPAARRVAGELGVDLSAATGTGPGGRILKEDVLTVAAALPGQTFRARLIPEEEKLHAEIDRPQEIAFPARGSDATLVGDQVVPFTRMRQRIADRLTLSKQTIPHFHLSQEVDMTDLQEWRQDFNRAKKSRVTVTDLVIYAVARALAEFRRLNAHVEKNRLLVRQAVNVGVAIAVDDGLLTPVIAAADQKSLLEISRLSKQNTEAARRGVVDSTAPGTFTITSLGQFGIPLFQPIINPPESAILAVGAIQPRVVAVPGGIGVRRMMWLVLGCDHRAVDGEYAARFLWRLKELLETTWRLKERNSDTMHSKTTGSPTNLLAHPGESKL